MRRITSTCKKRTVDFTQREAEDWMRQSFRGEAKLYLEMFDKVVIGLYNQGSYQIRMDHQGVQDEFPWEYVQKLIVFDDKQELRLFRRNGNFYGRLRQDESGEDVIYVMDQDQLMWGEAQKADEKWSLLNSRRVSGIWIPAVLEKGCGTMGLQVRKYFEFPDAAQGRGLALQVDERMMGFCKWPREEGSV